MDTHPEDYSVDLVMLDDGSRIVGAQVMTMNGSARAGSVDLPYVGKKKDKWDLSERTDNEATAIVGMMRGNPVVMGFIYPQVSQMTFDDPDRRMNRHQSDVYSTIDGSGNIEVYHPSGAFVRIGESPLHEDLGRKNFDKNFDAVKNKDKKPHIRIGIGEWFVNLSPDGDFYAKSKNATIEASEISLRGSVVVDGGLSAKGDVSGGGISLRNHVHTNVNKGEDESGPPPHDLGGSVDPDFAQGAPLDDPLFNPFAFAKLDPNTLKFTLRGRDGTESYGYWIVKGPGLPSRGVITDRYGNLIHLRLNPRKFSGGHLFVQDLVDPYWSGYEGSRYYVDENGDVLSEVKNFQTDIYVDEIGIVRNPDPIDFNQAVPSGDPLPDSKTKIPGVPSS